LLRHSRLFLVTIVDFTVLPINEPIVQQNGIETTELSRCRNIWFSGLGLVDLMVEDRHGGRRDIFWWMELTERRQPGKRGIHQLDNRRLCMK
jgi:hypothetical protein